MTEIKITPDVQARLKYLENKNGQITPAIVVEDAKNEASPLHNLFDWNVRSAAAKYWLHQARIIIHSVRVISATIEKVSISASYYVRDPSVNPKQQGYISIAELMKDPDLARESVRLEFSRAEGALTRAKAIASALHMDDEIEALVVRLMGLQQRLDLKAKPHKAGTKKRKRAA